MEKPHGHTDDDSAEPSRPSARPGEHLERLVDDMEKKVEQNRADEGAEGNVADREQQQPIDTGDEAPD